MPLVRARGLAPTARPCGGHASLKAVVARCNGASSGCCGQRQQEGQVRRGTSQRSPWTPMLTVEATGQL